jgi:succinoglycan biosynthesis transport protein ExoP
VEQQSTPLNDSYDDEVIDLRYYLLLLRTVFYRYYKKIVLFSLICVFAAIMITQSLAPVFVATVTLHIAPRDTGVFNATQLWYERNDPAFQKTQIGILASHKLMRYLVERIELHKAEILQQKSAYEEFIEEWLPGLKDANELNFPVSESLLINETAVKLGRATSVKAPPIRERSYLINVSVTLPDPELAALAANTLADVYIEEVFNTAVERALKNQSWLTERLVILREDVRIAERKLQQYRESEDILGRSAGRGELDQELDLVAARYFKAREERLVLENLHEQVKDIRSANTKLENIPAVMTNGLVQNLQDKIFNLLQRKSELEKRYGSRHNKMIALESELVAARQSLKNQVANVIEGIKTDYQVAVKSERSLEETLSSARGRKQSLGRKQFQQRELEQELDSKRTVYSVFLRKFNEEDASGPLQNTNVWVTDPATVPQKASGRSLMTIVTVVLILSLFAGLGMGILLELIDNTFNRPEDVELKLGMEVLGILPLISDTDIPQEHSAHIGHHYYVDSQTSVFAEAVRTARTSLALMTLKNPAKTILVTSSQPGEGKTTVALSLAASFGMTSKVLLMEADFRRPSIRRTREPDRPQKLGLSDVIAGATTVEDCLIHDDDARIDLLSAGRISPNPLELLGSAQFNSLLNELSERYDKIIIDSAPCLPVSDSYLLGAQVDSIVFVVKAAATTVSTVRAALKRFNSLNIPISGLLLNCVDFEAKHNEHRYVGYYDSYGYGESEQRT